MNRMRYLILFEFEVIMKNAAQKKVRASGKSRNSAAFPVRDQGKLSALEIKELKRTLAALIVSG